MYDNLSNRLRGESEVSDASPYIKELMKQAADAICSLENVVKALGGGRIALTVIEAEGGRVMVKCKNGVNLVADWCDMKADSPDPDMERECHWFAHATNYDRVMSKTPEELAEWYWWMLRYVQGYTDSRVALLDWLRQEAPHDQP